MARQNMHCALRRTCSHIPKDAGGGNPFVFRESLEQLNLNASSKDYEVASVVWGNSNYRDDVLTFFALEPNGQWRIVTLPLQCPDNTMQSGSAYGVNMDGSHLVCPSSVSSLKTVRHKPRKEPALSRSSVKSLTARSFSGLNFQHQSQNKGLANRASKQNGLLEDKGKTNSRKKVRKKGKRNKKLSGDTGLAELDCARGSSTSETDANKGIDNRVGPLPYATTPAVSLPKHSCSGEYSDGNSVKGHATSKTCTSCIDKVDASEAVVPSALRNFSNKHHLSNSENGLQTSCPGFSILNGEVQDTHFKPISCYDDPYSNVFSETNTYLVLDSVSLRSNSIKSSSADEEISGSHISKSPGYIVRKGDSSPGDTLNDVVDSNSPADATNCGKQGCTSGDKHLEVLEKREKQIKGVPKNSSVYRVSSVGNLHGRFGKENNHSVWQKVQRNDADEGKYESTKLNSVCSQFDSGFKEAVVLKKHRNVVDANTLSNSEDKSQTKLKVSVKLKRKTSPGSKHVYKYYSRKVSHAIKAQSNLCMRIDMQRNEISDTPAQMNGQKELDTVSRSHSKTSYRRVGFQPKRVESVKFKPVHSSQVCPNELKPLESVYTTVSSLIDQNAENQTSSLSRSCNSLDPSELLEELSAVHLHTPIDDEVAKADKELSPADHSKQDTSSEPVMRKWIPVGIKDSGLPSLNQPSSLSMTKIDVPAGERMTLENTAEEELASDSHILVSSINSGVMCMGQSSENVNGSPSKDDVQVQKLMNQRTCTPKKYSSNPAAATCLVPESKDQNTSASENDLSKIVCAVNDAHRAQLASEAIQMATGFPIAEFEKLLHSASPVVYPSYNIVSCQTCSPDRVIGASLCKHETPNISLKSLWEWYEKHGSYGLEVKAEGYDSKRLGTDCDSFRAYFVPFLSAVQLFRKCKGHRTENGNGNMGNEAKKSEKSSNMGHLPIFSVLIPQPRTEDSSYLVPESDVCCSKLSSICIKDNVSIQPVDWSDDLELLFEYFESEQPQKRRPLFDMIKELVRGDGPSQCRAYGDPTILDSVGLRDLHPKSWYSVGWYPIYRIPDGNFRAAFLTYHSLGHLVCRDSTFNSLCGDACVVCPVVGLQSYNAQGECWFQPKHPTDSHTAEVLNINPSEVLKERLGTLEQTASLMARAAVTKGGGHTFMNRQPDYEFFLSRQRW